MFPWWRAISIFLWAYTAVYILSHTPFDIVMLAQKKMTRYPSPQFGTLFLQMPVPIICYMLTSYYYWIYIVLTPLAAWVHQRDVFTNFYLSPVVSIPLRILGATLMGLGLFTAILGRIGRGCYLREVEPQLATRWGHRLVRHPEYLMYITGFLGLPLLCQQYWLYTLFLGIYPYIKIAIHEEQVLLEIFGEEYRDYQVQVGMFFPRFGVLLRHLKKREVFMEPHAISK